MDSLFDAQGHVSVPSKQRHGAGAVVFCEAVVDMAICNFGKDPPPIVLRAYFVLRGYEAHDCPLIIPEHFTLFLLQNSQTKSCHC